MNLHHSEYDEIVKKADKYDMAVLVSKALAGICMLVFVFLLFAKMGLGIDISWLIVLSPFWLTGLGNATFSCVAAVITFMIKSNNN